MNIVIAPDKFKGTIDSFSICTVLAESIGALGGDYVIDTYPMADGGDGFSNVMAWYTRAQRMEADTVDPLGRPIEAAYFIAAASSVAIIEVAAASGLALLTEIERDVMRASTYGTGLLIKDAISRGATTIILGLGGSATNDGGTGILQALDFIFADNAGDIVSPSGGTLSHIESIAVPATFQPINFQLAVDVLNPLTGVNGAARTYAVQKGATAEDVEALDRGLAHLAGILATRSGEARSDCPGMGAAGGIAAGISAFYNTSIQSGADMIINASGLEKAIAAADLVITGEGRIDSQTGHGKLAARVLQLSRKHNVRCVAVCGQAEINNGFDKIVQLVNHATVHEAMHDTSAVLKRVAPLLIR